MLDPRHRNLYEKSSSLVEFVHQYADRLASGLKSVDVDALNRALTAVVSAAQKGARIYSIGNGGSAAIADHLCCDFTKGTFAPGHSTLIAHSMASNSAICSAIANDYSFGDVFAKQVEFVGAEGDILIAISSSGNSANIIRAAEAAHQRGMTVIGFSGFSGGRLAEIADISMHVDVMNYGIVEDCHQAIMHIIAQIVAQRRDGAICW